MDRRSQGRIVWNDIVLVSERIRIELAIDLLRVRRSLCPVCVAFFWAHSPSNSIFCWTHGVIFTAPLAVGV